MKEITIIQENVSPLVFQDSDERPIEEYTLELSKVLESNNINILNSSSCSVISRPHKIVSIIVRDLQNPSEEKVENTKEIEANPDDGIISD